MPTRILACWSFPWFLFSGALVVACAPAGAPPGSGPGANKTDTSSDPDGLDVSDDDDDLVGGGDFGTGAFGECGDGVLDISEACDDGTPAAGDGCTVDCSAVEPGFLCHKPGAPCVPFVKCGDGNVSFPEQCDDGAISSGDGCSARCKIEIGFKCTGAPSVCAPSTCGDSVVEGAEGCDDGNIIPFDGCDARCQWEPQCTNDGCMPRCGDGIVLGGEECDDANDLSGDGCSADCSMEPGYSCIKTPCEQIGGECVLRVPVVLRDFAEAHADFQPDNGGGFTTALVEPELDAEHKPVLAAGGPFLGFSDWYRDAPDNSGAFVSDIVLFDNGAGGFVNRYGAAGERWEAPVGTPICQPNVNGGLPCPVDGNPYFFPVDAIPNPVDMMRYPAGAPQPFYGGYSAPQLPDLHNFHFTTEVAYWFIFEPAANAKLTFIGDDDVWVFVNGRLAVDLGGLHEPVLGSIELGPVSATWEVSTSQDGAITDSGMRPIADFGLIAGGAYEIKVFHAERMTKSSSFQLTLAGFDTSRSDCAAVCGDGILGGSEECDDGVNDGGYNECQPDCILDSYCGDGIRQPDELCDDNDPAAPASCRNCRLPKVR